MGKIWTKVKEDEARALIRKALRKTPEGAEWVEVIARGQGPMRTLAGMGWEVNGFSAISHTTYHMRKRRAEVEQDILSAAA